MGQNDLYLNDAYIFLHPKGYDSEICLNYVLIKS